jgi:hypothetical protein
MAINPAALTPQQLVTVLAKAGGNKVTEADVRRDIAEGAPTNADGTMHLVHYTAWLAEQVD